MKKINMKHDNKDRIICVSDFGKHRFYYQPVGTRDRLWLFDTKNYSGSVFAFFRKYGRCLDGIGFSMTVKEMYAGGYVQAYAGFYQKAAVSLFCLNCG